MDRTRLWSISILSSATLCTVFFQHYCWHNQSESQLAHVFVLTQSWDYAVDCQSKVLTTNRLWLSIQNFLNISSWNTESKFLVNDVRNITAAKNAKSDPTTTTSGQWGPVSLHWLELRELVCLKTSSFRRDQNFLKQSNPGLLKDQ